MQVYLVRHGEDRAAREARFGDAGLTSQGEKQARQLGERLREVPFRSCLVSPLRRARETARLLLEGRDVPLEPDPRLAEGAVGDLDGLSIEEAKIRHPEDFRLGHTVVARLAAAGRTAPGGEPRAAFLTRAGAASARIERELATDGAPLLVVSHGGILNYLLQRLLRIPVRDEVLFGFEHCGVLRIITHREEPGFGPFAMLCFSPRGGDPSPFYA